MIFEDYVQRLTFKQSGLPGFTLEKTTKRTPHVTKSSLIDTDCTDKNSLVDTDCIDDISLTTDTTSEAHILFAYVGKTVEEVGLYFNLKKTRGTLINTTGTVKGKSGVKLSQEADLKYLGSWILTIEKELVVRKAQAWTAAR